MFHLLKKPVENQYLEVLRTLVSPESLVPLQLSAQFESTTDVQLNIFRDPKHQKYFDIYDPVTIFNFPKKFAQNKYICVGS